MHGMSPYGLVSRVTSADIVAETDNAISICIGAAQQIEMDRKI